MKKDLKEYDVFISYSRKDYVDKDKIKIPGNEVQKIKDALTEAGISYWFDEEGIYSGVNFVEEIVTNIEEAKVFLFLSSANSNKSPWTCKEIATADELKKHIIPVRLDSSPYDKVVLFRLVNLDYIEYYTNPQKGREDMITSIKTYLEKFAEEEQHRVEEENQRQIEQKQQLQKNIEEIRLKCSKLNNEETKLEAERDNLLLDTEITVSSSADKEELKNEIITSSPIRQKSVQEIQQLKSEIEKLIVEKEHLAASIERNLTNISKGGSHGFRWWFHLSYLVLISACILGWVSNCSQKRELRQQYDDANITIESLRDSVRTDTARTTNYHQVINKEIKSPNVNEYLYTGPINTEGKPEGKGRAVFPNKDTFEGTFANGMLTEGRYTFAKDGTSFIGGFNEKEKPDLSRGAYYNKSGKIIN